MNRMTVGEDTLRAMAVSPLSKRKLPRRGVALVIDKYLRNFAKGTAEPRWIAIPGLRGVGKTTMVAQLYLDIECEKDCKIYITLDDATRTLGVNLAEILEVYEHMLGVPFESLKKKVYLFLDEVQYDDTWALTLKTLYDKTKNVFILCTGSSALSLHTNPDSSRRLTMTPIYPLTFTEYQLLKSRHFPIVGLGDRIRRILFQSKNAEEVFEGLKPLESEVGRYWRKVGTKDLQQYLKYGTLPSALALTQESLIYTNINHTLTSVLSRDLPQLNTFDKQTTDKLTQILYIVASNELTSYRKISEAVGLDYKVITSVFDALEKTELLFRIYPYGSHESQMKKPSKYLFTSPAFRAMYYNLVGSVYSYDEYKGKLFEDVVGMYLYRIFSNAGEMSITYDTTPDGADFVLSIGLQPREHIAIEASLGKKGSRQALKTMESVKCKYGLVITSSPLRLDETKTCVAVPLQYFLLI